MTAGEDELRERDVAWFFKLHPDTLKEVKADGPEAQDDGVRSFTIKGKERPCLILDRGKDYFRVWYITTKPKGPKGSYTPLIVAGLHADSAVQHKPQEIAWVHRNFMLPRREYISLDEGAFRNLLGNPLSRTLLGAPATTD
jgi:hypothetical protein